MTLDLEAISARCAAATPAPWLAIVDLDDHELRVERIIGPDHDDGCQQLIVETDSGFYPPRFHDAAFIAHSREDVPALVARVRELEAEKAASGVTDDELRAVVAEYTAKVDAAIEKGKTNLGCHWCLEVADITDSNAIDRHYRTCPKSPLVIETARLRGVVESLIAAFGGHGAHWDHTMSHGAGCEQCHRERDARTAAREALSFTGDRPEGT